jgi:hypothetical protein
MRLLKLSFSIKTSHNVPSVCDLFLGIYKSSYAADGWSVRFIKLKLRDCLCFLKQIRFACLGG